MSEIEFVDGLMVKKPHEKAPDFVKAALSIKRKDLGNWLRQRDDDWINVDIKESKNGKWYAAVNDFKPEKKAEQDSEPPANDFQDDVIPF